MPKPYLATTPLQLPEQTVLPEWIDYNGHMNVAFYVLAFDRASDQLFDWIGFGEDYARAENCGPFTLEAHIVYAQEVKEGDPLAFIWRLIDYDEKRVHHMTEMRHAREGYLAATFEQITMHVDLAKRRSSPMPETTRRALAEIWSGHEGLAHPPQLGSRIGIRRKVA